MESNRSRRIDQDSILKWLFMERVFLDFFLFNIFLLIKETLLLQDLLDTKFVISILEFCFKLDNIEFFFSFYHRSNY